MLPFLWLPSGYINTDYHIKIQVSIGSYWCLYLSWSYRYKYSQRYILCSKPLYIHSKRLYIIQYTVYQLYLMYLYRYEISIDFLVVTYPGPWSRYPGRSGRGGRNQRLLVCRLAQYQVFACQFVSPESDRDWRAYHLPVTYQVSIVQAKNLSGKLRPRIYQAGSGPKLAYSFIKNALNYLL